MSAPERSQAAPTLPPTEPLPLTSADDTAATLGFAPEAPPPPALPGYEILGVLGRGGMGIVYKARQVQANRLVALKMILNVEHAGTEMRARFETEAQALARLQHPHIVAIHEVGTHQGIPFFSLEFCSGGSLDRKLAERPLEARAAAALIEKLARALHAAHQAQVLHRDLKPANVLLAADGEPRITDFGLARQLDEKGQTQTGAILGTPSYMAPEQAEGKLNLGPAADIYALGAILYEGLTGRPPFKAATPLDTVRQVVAVEPAPPRQLQSNTPRDLETICLKCLHKEPSKRYASARDLAEDLQRFLSGEPIRARPTGRVERALKWARRRPAVAALLATVAVALLVLVIGAAWFTGQLCDERDRANRERDKADDRARGESQARQEAEDQRRDALHSLYVGRLRLAQSAWHDAQAGRVLDLLAETRALIGSEDPRSFEWYHLRHLCFSPLRTLRGHRESVAAVAFAPDGHTLATASGEYGNRTEVILWDLVSGKPQRSLDGKKSLMTAIAFSPDGSRLAAITGGAPAEDEDLDATPSQITVWNKTGAILLILTAPEPFTCLAFCADGTRLACGCGSAIKVWDAGTGKPLPPVGEHAGAVTGLAFSRDGKWLLSSSFDGTCKVWNLGTGKEERTISGGGGVIAKVAISGDGQWLAAACWDRKLRVWERATGQLKATLHGHTEAVTGVAFSPNSQLLASASGDQTVRLWSWPGGEEVRVLRGNTQPVADVAFSPDGTRLVSAGRDGAVRVWDTRRNPERVEMRDSTGTVYCVAFHPDGVRVARGDHGSQVTVWSRLQPQRGPIHTFPATSKVKSLAFSPDGQRLAYASASEVRLGSLESGKLERHLTGHEGDVLAVAYHPDGKRLASSGLDDRVRLWDLETGQSRLLDSDGVRLMCLAFQPGGRFLVGGGVEGEVWVWDLERGERGPSLKVRGGPISGLAFRKDGRLLAASSGEPVGVQTAPGSITVWDFERGAELAVLKGHAGPVQAVAFTPDGKRLASAGWDRRVRVWDLGTRQEVLSLEGARQSIFSLAFSPDGTSLLAGGGAVDFENGTVAEVLLWQAPRKEELLSPR